MNLKFSNFEKSALKYVKKPIYYLINAFTLSKFALKWFFTQILLVFVLRDWTAESTASPARLVVQLVLVHFFILFHAL